MRANSAKICEINEILLSDNPDKGLEQKKYLLKELIPELNKVFDLKPEKNNFKDIWPHTLKVVNQAKKDKIIRWAAFFHDLGKAEAFKDIEGKVTFYNHEIKSAEIFKNFANKHGFFSEEEKEKIYFLVKHLGYVEAYNSNWSDSAVRRFSRDMGKHVYDLLELSKADVTTRFDNKRKKIYDNIEELKTRIEKIREKDKKPPLLPKGLGIEIMKTLNLGPGKAIGDIKNKLLEDIKNGKLEPFKDCKYYINYVQAKKN